MAQKKLVRFAAIKTFPNVLEYPKDMAGKWHEFFQNNQPLVLELACGRGEYTVGLAARFPEKNFIGVDIKGNRIFIGAKKCLDLQLKNAAFLRTQIQMLADYYTFGEVEEIWITFPDPQLRISRAKNRLTHPKFLRIYRQLLKPGGFIHLKTDSPVLYHFTKRVIQLYGLTIVEDNDHVFDGSPVKEELTIKTHYESLDIAGHNRIHYIKFCLQGELSESLDEQLQMLTRQYEEFN